MKRVLIAGLCALMAACATGHDKARPAGPKDSSAKPETRHREGKKADRRDTLTATNPAPEVTLSNPQPSTLGDLVRQISDTVGGSLVLMHGIENRPVGPVDFRRAKFGNVVEQLASMANCKYEAYPNFWFVYPEGYEALLEVSVSSGLDASFAGLSAGMNFGAGTPLFEVFAVLSTSLGKTIMADNLVAEARCGALTLSKIPLPDALDALIKSARMNKGAFQVESTPEYLFIYATQNAAPHVTLLNAETLTAEQNALLDKPVDVFLPANPDDPSRLAMQRGATALSKVLGTLSARLGVTVVAEEGLGDLPVNPVALIHVRIRTVMDLLIRQWPLAEFGYQLGDNQLVIQRRK